MKLVERLDEINTIQVNEPFIQQIENIYRNELPEEVKRIVSLSGETMFYNDKPILRGLSNSEILNASEDLEVDFVSQSLLPVFDIGDNDFAAYDFSERCWCLFNIIDEIKFRKSNSLLTVLAIGD